MKIINLQQLIFTLILSVCIIAPLNNDIFISGIPAMKQYFIDCDVSLILSFSLLGLAVAQLFYGPFFDRFGRKPVLLIGLSLFTLASAQVMTTHSFTLLLIGRFVQSLGACSAITAALTIARDISKKEELIKATSLIMAIMGVGPATAPLMGSLLNYLWGWRASFTCLFIFGCFYILLVAFFFKETHLNKNMEALKLNKIVNNYLDLVKNPNFLKYCITSGFSYGVLFSYLNLSSFFIIEQMQFSLISFGIIVATNALAIITTAIIIPKFTHKISFQLMTRIGLVVIFTAGILMSLINELYQTNVYTFMLPVFLTTIGIGMIRPTASAGAMQQVTSQTAGSAASFFNFFSFVSGTIAIIATSKIINSVEEFGLFIAVMGGIALTVSMVFCSKLKPDPAIHAG